MKHHETLVVGGVDAHADRHYTAALDERRELFAAGYAMPAIRSGASPENETICGVAEIYDHTYGAAGVYASRSPTT
jgi:hypothetical protein